MLLKHNSQALVCVLRLIKGVPPHQGKLSGSRVTSAKGTSVPALQALLQVLPGLCGALFHMCDPADKRQACGEACALAAVLCRQDPSLSSSAHVNVLYITDGAHSQ